MKVIKLGLVAGRHPMLVQDYILQEVKDPSDIEFSSPYGEFIS